MYLFTPKHPDGGRYLLYVKKPLVLTDEWGNANVYLRDASPNMERPHPRSVRVKVRRADCGLGCRCAAEISAPFRYEAARLKKATRLD